MCRPGDRLTSFAKELTGWPFLPVGGGKKNDGPPSMGNLLSIGGEKGGLRHRSGKMAGKEKSNERGGEKSHQAFLIQNEALESILEGGRRCVLNRNFTNAKKRERAIPRKGEGEKNEPV